MYVALAILDSLCRPGCPQTQRSAYLCFPSAGIEGMHHYACLILSFKIVYVYVCLWSPEETIEHWSSLELKFCVAVYGSFSVSLEN